MMALARWALLSHSVVLLSRMNTRIFDQQAARQEGLITATQVDEHVTSTQRRYLVHSGQLIVVRRGVYRLPGSPETWRQRLLAVLLMSGDKYVVSHRAAALWHGLGNVWKDEILEFSTAQRLAYGPADLITHNAPLPGHHIVKSGPFRITSVARTLADLVAVTPPEKVAVAFDHALSRGLVKLDHVELVLTDIHRPGKPRLGRLQTLLAERRAQPTFSWLQRKTLKWLKDAGLPTPVTEFPIPTEICDYHVDIAYPDARLGIECLGYAFHGTRTAFDDDARRHSAIAASGLTISFVTTETNQDEFIRNVRLSLRRSDASAQLSPSRSDESA
jgi:hypothetical protein